MQLITKTLTFSLFFLATVFLQSCLKNTITSSWVDQSFKGPVKGKILVVAVFKDPDVSKIFEDSFADSLTKAGAVAVSSHKYDKAAVRHSNEWLETAAKQSGASVVLIAHASEEKKEMKGVGPHGLIVGGGMYEGGAGDYHSYVVEVNLVPGYVLNKTEDLIGVTLFDVQTDKPIWSVSSKSVNLRDLVRTDDEQLESLYIKDMKRDHLL